jgi:serine/threonine protein kinase
LQLYDGWEAVPDDTDALVPKRLGKGGQGEVYLVRSPERVARRYQADHRAGKLIIGVGHTTNTIAELARCLTDLGGPDPPESLGALKKFVIPSDDKNEEARAIGRLESEVKALKALRDNPGVLRLLHANVASRLIVTEFHPRGTLDKNLHLYKGDVLGALLAFKPLVDGLCGIHREGAIHRDIKTENIFLTASGQLVLGDFGIVLFQEGDERLTTTYERVGSHEWMAPWAYRRERLELTKISPSLDIFPMAKVLWSMIAGRNGFPFWEYTRDENNLEKLFPDDPIMALVNERILSTRIVREAEECDGSAGTLRDQVDGLISHIQDLRGFRPDNVDAWPCKVCGRGKYKRSGPPKYQIRGFREGGPVNEQEQRFYASVCDHCGHADFFTR